MIHVPRRRIPKPEFWRSPEFRTFMADWGHFHLEEGGTRGTQRRSPSGQLSRFRELALPPLLEAFGGKCAYTEQKITLEDATVIFHRPEADAVGMEGDVSPEHYWWAVGDWTNWYPASRAVALAKSTVFPVVGPRTPPPRDKTPSRQWLAKNRDHGLLLEPGRDHPAWYLEFQHDGSVHPRRHLSPTIQSRTDGHSPGEITIKVLDLNNGRLLEGRSQAFFKARDWLVDFGRVADRGAEFAGAARQAAAGMLLALLHGLDKTDERRRRQLKGLIRKLAEELAAHIAFRGVPWSQGSAPLSVADWQPIRKVIAREWHELDDEGWARMIAGGTGDGRRAATSFSIGAETPIGSPAAATTRGAGGTGDGRAASDLESERVVERTARVAEIKIRNFKAIEDIDLELATDGVELLPPYGSDDETLQAVNWTAFLGENGSGKSCCLQAIGLALAGDRLDQLIADGELEWRKLLRRGADDGRVFLRFTGDTIVDLRFDGEKHWWVGGAPRIAAFVRGYGATRLLESKTPGKGTGDGSIIRLANLYNPRAPVINAERWLLDFQDEGDFHVAALALGGFLGAGEPAAALTDPVTPEPFITRDHERQEVLAGGDPLSYASDGYRAMITLVCDVMAGLGVGLSDMRNATGIVLLDEIGAHLHPRWKMEITSRLRRELPQLQFLVSTHEPLCLRGLFEREVVRVRKTRPKRTPGSPPVLGRVSVEIVERSPSDYRVDQLLTSEFFGLDTTIDPDIDRRFQTYYRLLAMTPGERQAAHPRDPSRTLEDEMLRLRAELERLTRPVLGFTRRDQLVYEAIDKFLIAEAGSPAESRRDRRQKIFDKIKDIWAPPDVLRQVAGDP